MHILWIGHGLSEGNQAVRPVNAALSARISHKAAFELERPDRSIQVIQERP